MRTDDSVVRAVAGGRRPCCAARAATCPARSAAGRRRARPLLACGAELKSTFCVAKGDRAWVGHHIGDLQQLPRRCASFREGIEHFERLFAVAPEVVAHDLHPDYLVDRAYALEREGVELVGVQHHHAHLAACLAEHGEDRARRSARSSTAPGYGPDGTVWGGELLVGDLRGFERAGAPAAGAAARRRPRRRASRGGWRARGSRPRRRAAPPARCRRVDAGALGGRSRELARTRLRGAR